MGQSAFSHFFYVAVSFVVGVVLFLLVWLVGCFCSEAAEWVGLLMKKEHSCYFSSFCVGSWRRRSG